MGVVYKAHDTMQHNVGPNDHATLTDLGIAKMAEGTRPTRTGMVVGTPGYLSPEQAKGEVGGPAIELSYH